MICPSHDGLVAGSDVDARCLTTWPSTLRHLFASHPLSCSSTSFPPVTTPHKVCLAKFNSSLNGTPELVIQDLTVNENKPAITGDNLDVRYTGWLLTENGLGKVRLGPVMDACSYQGAYPHRMAFTCFHSLQ